MMYLEGENSHYYYVMGWNEEGKKTAPRAKKKFNIYDDAVEYFNKLAKRLGYVEMFEYIGGKRKYLQSTADEDVNESKLLCETDDAFVREFEDATGLRLSPCMNGVCSEISGKDYEDILDIVSDYNKKNKAQIICWNDNEKDVTFIRLS